MIAVVDDDVCFAEETQELLYLSGFSSVVVVTHPHDSSLALLDRAELLILDLGLAATTALGVLDEVRQRGGNPAVVIVSGSGPEALGHVRSTATARGFRVLGALPKPVSPADLLELLGPFGRKSGASPQEDAPDRASLLANDASRAAGGALTLRHTQSLDYAGTYLCSPAADRHGLSLVERMLATPQELGLEDREGLLIGPLADELFLSRSERAALCRLSPPPGRRNGSITFELGPDVHAEPLRYAAQMVELRLAGFNLLLRVPAARPPMMAQLFELPISHLAIDARQHALGHRSEQEAERLRQTIHLLGRRDITPICLFPGCDEELAAAGTLGFPLIAAAPSSTEEHRAPSH